MSRLRPALPPRNLVALILGITAVPLLALFWLGWRLLDLDRVQQSQQAQQRLGQSAQLVVAALQRAVSVSQQHLAAGAEGWPQGAVAVTFRGDRVVETLPRGRVAYLPTVQPLPEAPTEVFASGDELEIRRRDLPGAIQFFSELTKSADPTVRAGALLRMGRILASSGRVNEALSTYAELSRIDNAAISDTPASLVGLYMRCDLFEHEKRGTELLAEARRLDAELKAARWSLTGPQYELHKRDTALWLGLKHAETETEVFADAVEQLWQQRRSMLPSGQMTLAVGGQTFAVLWQTVGDSYRALIASPEFVKSQWVEPADVVAVDQRVSFRTGGNDNASVAPVVNVRSGETQLPWDVVVTSLDPPGSDPAFLFRRRVLIAGFVLLSVMATTASYLIYRAIGREIAVVRLQSDFVAAVSHEFRTPLTSLRQFTTMLRENPKLSDQRRTVCYDAQMRAADRLVSLVESLLDFGRMEAGARRYQLEQRDCADVVRRTVDEFRMDPQAAHYDIELHEDGPVQAEADAEALSRAVRNLLENAVKYSPEDRHVDVTLRRSNGHVRIVVRDHGIGIPATEQGRIFKKFQRGEQARTRGIKGTGIGLAMVDEIVRAHHGHVELESEPGAGSTFTIVLPAKD